MNTEELENKIELIDKEVFKIFCMVTNEKNISVYKNQLLSAKLQILEEYLSDIFSELFKKETKKMNKLIFLNYLSIILSLLSVGTIFLNLFFGVILVIINYCGLKKFNEIFINEVINSSNNINAYGKKMQEMEIQFRNCWNFLNINTNDHIIEINDELNDEKLKQIELGDELININIINYPDDDLEQLLANSVKNNYDNEKDMVRKRIKKR